MILQSPNYGDCTQLIVVGLKKAVNQPVAMISRVFEQPHFGRQSRRYLLIEEGATP